MEALRRYLKLLTIPGVRPMIAAGIIGRLPLGMVPLAIVLLVRGSGDSYAIAGLAVGAYSLAAAVAVPTIARLIDRNGQTRILISIAVLFPAASLVFVLLAHGHAPVVGLLAGGLLLGAGEPPIGACIRTLWGELAPAGPARDAAYAFESSFQEIMFVVGPVLVAGFATAASPSVALLFAGGAGAAGTLWFAATPVSRAWRPLPRGDAPHPRALRAPGVLTIVVASVAMGAAFGAIEVVAPAFAEAHGHRAAAGFATGAFALGSLLGGAAIAMAASHQPRSARYLVALAALALGLLLPLAAGSIVVLSALLLVAGLPIAPAFASAYSLVNELGIPGSSTESFAWISTAVIAGAAAGTALAGVVVGQGSVALGFAFSAAMAGLAALFAASRRWSLWPAAAVRAPMSKHA